MQVKLLLISYLLCVVHFAFLEVGMASELFFYVTIDTFDEIITEFRSCCNGVNGDGA